MLERRYYEGWNKNDEYLAKKDVLKVLDELEVFDKHVKKFFGPKKVQTSATSARRSIRIMKEMLDVIAQKIQMTSQDYKSDYY